MYKYSFENLEVWKISKTFVIKIYNIAQKIPQTEKYGIIDQLKRASVSVPTNLAEGSGRKTGKDKAYFTQISYGSIMECLNLLIISYDLNYISETDYNDLRKDIEIITQKLSNLRRYQLDRFKEL